jgi:hypothetical protein
VEAVRAISMLLQGPFEIGNMILGFEGVNGIMLALAQSDRAIHQVRTDFQMLKKINI